MVAQTGFDDVKASSETRKSKASRKTRLTGERTSTSITSEHSSAKQETELPHSKDIITFLNENHITYVDNRSVGGALWLFGGEELSPIAKAAENFGVHFKYARAGGKTTKGKPGWYIK